MITRRKFIKGSLVVGGIGLTGLNVFAIPKKVRIGVMAPSHCALPVLYAQTAGLFKKAELDAEIVYVKSVQEVIAGLQKGDLAFGQLVAPIVLSVSQKTPLVATQVLGTNGGVLAVSSRQNIATVADLKGKTIGVHSPYMIHNLILDYILEMIGPQTQQQITIKVVPMNDMAKALKDGVIDGFIHPEPLPTSLETQGLSKTLLVTKTFWANHPCCMLTAKGQTFQKEKNLVADVTRATMIAGLTLDSSKTREKAISAALKSADLYQGIPMPVLTKAFSSERSDFYPFPFKSSGMIIGNRMKNEQLLPQEIDTEKLVDEVFLSEFALSVLREAAKEVPDATVPQGINRQEHIRLS